jgi:hypothetical protein
VPLVITRLIGSDSVLEFSEELLELIRRVEATFPSPEWSVVFNDGDEEEDEEAADEIVVCRRYSGVLLPVAYVDLDEVEAMEDEGVDWLSELAVDLARTEAQIEAEEGVDS